MILPIFIEFSTLNSWVSNSLKIPLSLTTNSSTSAYDLPLASALITPPFSPFTYVPTSNPVSDDSLCLILSLISFRMNWDKARRDDNTLSSVRLVLSSLLTTSIDELSDGETIPLLIFSITLSPSTSYTISPLF